MSEDEIKNISEYVSGENARDFLDLFYEHTQRDALEHALYDDLSRLSVQSQERLLDYMISDRSPDSFSRIKKFSRGLDNERERDNFLQSFLSLAQGGEEMGEKILAIAEAYPKEEASAIFTKYAELVDATDRVEESLKKEFPGADLEMVREIAQRLLLKGKKLLDEFSSQKDMNGSELVKQLEKLRAENILLVEKYKLLREAGVVENIADLESVKTENLSGADALRNDKLMSFFNESYRDNYTSYSEEGLKSLLEKLRKNLSADNSEVYYMSSGDKILSAILLNKKEEEREAYLSALNVDPTLKETAAGRVLLEEVMGQLLERG